MAATLPPFPGTTGQRDWRTAFDAIKKLLNNGDDTVQVFRIMRALNTGSTEWGYAKLLATPEGGRIALEKAELAERFSDRAWVDSFAPGTVGAAYRDFLEGGVHDDPLVGDEAKAALTYAPTVTREDFHTTGRVTDRITSGAFFDDLGLERGFDPARDRIMLCGSMAMIKDVAALVETYGLTEGSNAEPAEYVLERAFVG